MFVSLPQTISENEYLTTRKYYHENYFGLFLASNPFNERLERSNNSWMFN